MAQETEHIREDVAAVAACNRGGGIGYGGGIKDGGTSWLRLGDRPPAKFPESPSSKGMGCVLRNDGYLTEMLKAKMSVAVG